MPSFIPDGPYIPDQLVHDLEDDRVVLFCGAGVSMGAGLPDFKGLVKTAYNECGVTPPDKRSADWKSLDRMLGSLEAMVGGPTMREAIARRLNRPPTTTDLHSALLRLARLKRGDGLRLVTTNFDNYFERVEGNDLQIGENLDSAPNIPVPRNDSVLSWRSVVHLHGRIKEPYEQNHNLILTSADFGRAYLTDAWAARFVARLFAEFSVLFVGYSLDDPVLRYMTDAFAAEAATTRSAGLRPPAYIFVPYNAKKPRNEGMWKSRHLEPISYHDGYHHRLLRKTLIEWARRRDDWLADREGVARRIGDALPESASVADVNNLMWAVGVGQTRDDPLGAQLLSKLDTPVPIGWLPKIEKRESELTAKWRFGEAEARENGLPLRPAPQQPVRSLLVRSGNTVELLSHTASAYIEWIIRHLESIDLIDWVCQKASSGQFLHPEAVRRIRRKLREPDLQIQPARKRFWRFICAAESWRAPRNSEQLTWHVVGRLEEDPDGPDVRTDLLAVLQPYLHIKPAIWRHYLLDPEAEMDEEARAQHESRLSYLANIEVELAGGKHVQEINKAILALPNADGYLADLSDVLTSLLKLALDLWALAEQADSEFDIGHMHRPSIEPHDQNYDFHSWTYLIDLLWRAWLSVDETSEQESRQLIGRWSNIRYPTFQRLFLAATARSRHTSASEKLEVLLDG